MNHSVEAYILVQQGEFVDDDNEEQYSPGYERHNNDYNSCKN